MRAAVGIAIAGAVGAVSRYGVEALVTRWLGAAFPWGTLVVNVSGAFVLGLLFTLLTGQVIVAPWIRSSLTIGLLGAYTTFSTLSLETFRLIEDRAYPLAAANAFGSLIGGLIAVYAGVVIGRVIAR
jgi:CrcB protein